VGALGYLDIFTDMFNAIDDGTMPRETFDDGYIVNAIIDAACASIKAKSWQSVDLKRTYRNYPAFFDKGQSLTLTAQNGRVGLPVRVPYCTFPWLVLVHY
jgi:hypothetical protein